jgi:hypothetical protein
MTTDADTTTAIITANTSRRRYWYQASSTAAVCRCGAPACLMTYSVQNTAVSRGDTGRSLKALDIRTAFSRYLEEIRQFQKGLMDN